MPPKASGTWRGQEQLTSTTTQYWHVGTASTVPARTSKSSDLNCNWDHLDAVATRAVAVAAKARLEERLAAERGSGCHRGELRLEHLHIRGLSSRNKDQARCSFQSRFLSEAFRPSEESARGERIAWSLFSREMANPQMLTSTSSRAFSSSFCVLDLWSGRTCGGEQRD